MSTFATSSETGAIDADPSQQNRAIKMGLRLLEDSSLASGSQNDALGNGGTVSPSVRVWKSSLSNCTDQLEYTTSTWILVNIVSCMTQAPLILYFQLQHNCLMDKANLLIRPTFEFGDKATTQEVTFTVSVYSDANIHLEQRRTVYPYEQTVCHVQMLNHLL